MRVYSAQKSSEASFLMPFRSYVRGVNHRGYNTTAPENTLPAYILSAKKGFHYVETDVSFTSDNVPVLLHDDTIDRTSNGTGNISDLTLEQVRQYDFGSWKSSAYAGSKIPTLEEFLVLCRNLGLHPYLELKPNYGDSYQDRVSDVVDVVNRLGMRGKVSYISFATAYLSVVKEFDPQARLVQVCNSVNYNNIDYIARAQTLKTSSNEVIIDSGSSAASEINACKQAGFPLEVWTVNTKNAILALDDYISGVTSDSVNAEYVLYEKSLG